jgi:GT2 family glycosyltransferase
VITVAVATLDRPEGLARCLTALATGILRPTQVVVVDQGRDGAEAPVAAAQQAGLDVIHQRQERLGLAASRNLALSIARGSIVAITDDDCVPDAGWVAALDRAFREDPDLAAVTGRVLPLGPDRPDLFAVSSRTGTSRAVFRGRTVPWQVGTGGNFALHRDWIARAGGYDERLGAGTAGGAGEDMDLLWRLLRAGARIRYEPDAVVFHERQSRERRLATRSSYGRGLGACCGLWLRGGDLDALGVLGRWLWMRAGMAGTGLRRRQWAALREELLVLRGTAAGLVYGLRGGRTA